MILCQATFTAIQGHIQPAGCRLDTPDWFSQELLKLQKPLGEKMLGNSYNLKI